VICGTKERFRLWHKAMGVDLVVPEDVVVVMAVA
jgi:hypothetical protein